MKFHPLPSLRTVLCGVTLSLPIAPAFALNDFSGSGNSLALPFEVTDAQWSLTSGAYVNHVTGIAAAAAVVTSAALPLNDANTAATVSLSTQFTVNSFAAPPAAGTPTTGFGLFSSTNNFSGTSPQSYYLADFAFADGPNTATEGRLRILSLGATNSDFTVTNGLADDDTTTANFAVVPGRIYTLKLTATRSETGLAMQLAVFDETGAIQIGTSAIANDPTPLAGTFFGYRNRYESGSANGAYQLTFDNLDILPDPGASAPSGITVTTAPVFPTTLPTPSTSTSSVVLRNLSTTQSATVSGAAISGLDATRFTVSTSLPLVIPAGGSAPLEIAFNSNNEPGFRSATLALTTDSPSPVPDQPLSAAYMALNSNFLQNGGFEAAVFPERWTSRLASAANTLAVPGLNTPSTKAAWMSSSLIELVQPVLSGSHFYTEVSFAINSTAFERGFNLTLKNQQPAISAVRCLNFRYDAGLQTFNAFSDQQPVNDGWGAALDLGTLEPSSDGNADGDLEDPEDVKKVYRLRLTGHGWGSRGATYDVELTEANSLTYTRKVTGLQRWQTTSGNVAAPTAIAFSTEFGNNPGFWVDDVTFVSTPAPTTPLAITGFSYTPLTSSGVLNYTAPLGLAYRVQASNDLTFWDNLSDEVGTGNPASFNEADTFGAPARFYRLNPR